MGWLNQAAGNISITSMDQALYCKMLEIAAALISTENYYLLQKINSSVLPLRIANKKSAQAALCIQTIKR